MIYESNKNKFGHAALGGTLEYEFYLDKYRYGKESNVKKVLNTLGYCFESFLICLKESKDLTQTDIDTLLKLILSEKYKKWLISIGSITIANVVKEFNDVLAKVGISAIFVAANDPILYQSIIGRRFDGLSQVLGAVEVLPILPPGAYVKGHHGIVRSDNVTVDEEGIILPADGKYETFNTLIKG